MEVALYSLGPRCRSQLSLKQQQFNLLVDLSTWFIKHIPFCFGDAFNMYVKSKVLFCCLLIFFD